MSSSCIEHGWRHGLEPCPLCNLTYPPVFDWHMGQLRNRNIKIILSAADWHGDIHDTDGNLVYKASQEDGEK